MTALAKLAVICYLVAWTTAAAWLGASLIDFMYPHLRSGAVSMRRDIIAMLPQIAPFIAAPLALYLADKIL